MPTTKRNDPGRARAGILIVAATVCAGLLWFILQQHGATTDAQTRLAVARERNARLSAELQRAAATVVPRPAPLPTEPGTIALPPTAPAPSPAAARRPPSLMDLAHDNPQLMNLWIANQRSQLQQRYGVLFQNLNLTPAQREKFKDIQTAGAARSTDIAAAAKEQGLEYDDPVLKKLRADSQKLGDEELVALLGETGFRAYQDFNKTIGIRGFVDGFAVQVAVRDPLTAAQAERLARALLAASPSNRATESVTVDWAAVDRTAQDFLSPGQFAAWKLGIAHNPYGGSRLDLELKKIYDDAKAKSPPKPPGS